MFSIYLAKKHAMRDKVASGTGQGTKMDVFSKNFQAGGVVISNPKIYVADFRPLYRFFWPFSEKNVT